MLTSVEVCHSVSLTPTVLICQHQQLLALLASLRITQNEPQADVGEGWEVTYGVLRHGTQSVEHHLLPHLLFHQLSAREIRVGVTPVFTRWPLPVVIIWPLPVLTCWPLPVLTCWLLPVFTCWLLPSLPSLCLPAGGPCRPVAVLYGQVVAVAACHIVSEWLPSYCHLFGLNVKDLEPPQAVHGI